MAKPPNPSLLKQEVHPETIVEGRPSDCGVVLVPDSQFFVPETQLEEPQNTDPLSPRAAALLERNSVKKSAETIDAPKLVFKPIVKESSANGPSVGFSFGQPTKVASKATPKVAVPTTQLSIKSPAAAPSENGGRDLLDAYTASAGSPKEHTPFAPLLPPAVTADVAPQELVDVGHRVIEELHAPLSHSSVLACKDQNGSGEQRSLYEIPADLPTSAPRNDGDVCTPRAAPKPKKGKNGKNGKRTGNKKPRGVPWPPRSSLAALHASKAPSTHTPGEQQRAAVSLALEQDSAQHKQTVKEDSGAADTYQGGHEQVSGGVLHVFEPLESQGSRPNELDNARLPEKYPWIEVADALPQKAIEQQALEAVSTQDDQTDLLQVTRFMIGPTKFPPTVPNVASLPHSRPHDTILPHSEVRSIGSIHHDPDGDRRNHNFDVKSAAGPGHQLVCHETHALQSMETSTRKKQLYQPDDSVLHAVMSHSQPHRVEKVQKKRGVPGGPKRAVSFGLGRSHGLDLRDDFDKTLEDLREAHHADKFRKDRELAIREAHFGEVKTLLKGEIQRSSDEINGWKAKCAALEEDKRVLRDKAIGNQKFVIGLEKDHEKSQKSVIAFQDECKKVLQHKIAEMEHEKISLQREFETTVDALAKGHRTLKSTIDDLYVRYVVSESKRKNLVESSAKQRMMYEEEKTRRKSLETKLLPSFESVRRQFGDRSTQILQELENLQLSVDGVASQVCEDTGVQECRDALRKLQDKPFLTTKDVDKAEGMLRFVHSSVCSKFDTLVQSMEHKKCPAEDVQTFISGQLQDLRADMLKFDAVVEESSKAQEAKHTLLRELEAERQQTHKLNEQLKSARRAEEELDMRRVQLEQQLAGVDGAAHGDNVHPADLMQVTEALREKIKELEEECRVAKAEVERLQRKVKKRDRKLADFEETVGKLKEEVVRMLEQLKVIVQPPDMSQLRDEVARDIQKGFTDKESGYLNAIQRISVERDDLRALVDQHDERNHAAKARCEEAKKDLSSTKPELDISQKEKMEIEARCKELQRMAQDHASSAVKVSELKEQVRQKSEELQSKSKVIVELQGALSESEDRRTRLQEECEQQQIEISQHVSAIDSLRQETDIERQEDHKKNEVAFELATNKAAALQKENEELRTKLEHAKVSEAKMSNAHATLVLERDSLHHHNEELESAKETIRTQIRRLQEELASKTRKYEDVLGTLRRDQDRSDSALKAAEAKVQLQKSEHAKKIEFDRRKYEAIVHSLESENAKAKMGAVERPTSQQQLSQSPLMPQDTFSQEIQNINSGKAKKKVDRGNTLVLNAMGASDTILEPSTHRPVSKCRSSAQGHSDNLFDEELHDDDFNQLENDQGLSVVDPAAEQVEETQERPQNLLLLEERVNAGTQGSLRGSKRFNPISAELSSLSDSLSEEELEQLEQESQGRRRLSTPVISDHRRNSQMQSSSEERVLETPTRSDKLSASNLHSDRSKDRPRSQANTASRLMPPPGSKSSLSSQHKPKHVTEGNDASSHTGYAHSRHENHSRSVRQPLSSSTGSQHASRQKSSDREDHASFVSNRPHGHKRQSTFEEGGSSKKHRGSSQSLPDDPSSGFVSISSHPSRAYSSRNSAAIAAAPSVSLSTGSRARDQRSSSIVSRLFPASRDTSSSNRARKQPSEASRSSAVNLANNYYGSSHQTRSKTQESKRFDQELGR